MNTFYHPTFSSTNDTGFPPVPPEAHQKAGVLSETSSIKNSSAYFESMATFVRAAFGTSTALLNQAAGGLIIDSETGETIDDLYTKIAESIPYSLCQTDHDVCCQLILREKTAKLPNLVKEALWIYSGYRFDWAYRNLIKKLTQH